MWWCSGGWDEAGGGGGMPGVDDNMYVRMTWEGTG